MNAAPKPREHTCITLFVPGRWTSLGEVEHVLPVVPFSIEREWIPNPGDGSFGQAFSFGTCSADEVRAIEGARGAVVLHLPVDLHVHRAAIATLAVALGSAGALGFRIEQSKLGFAAEVWSERLSAESSLSLFRIAVVTLSSKSTTRTLGLHAFSLPDVEIEATGDEAGRWLDVLALYMIDEDPVLASGHTFAPDAETPRRMIEWWPDTNYPEGHVCNNPFGVLRLGPPVTRGRPQTELRMTFVPALRALLGAARKQKDAPLTPEEILAIRDRGSCIAMDPRRAREMERARGYSDIDPERAAECWSAVESQTRG